MMPYSFEYFLFLPLTYLLFHLAGGRGRWLVLLAASLLFYAALDVPYLLLVLALVTLVSYGFGILLDRAQTPKKRCALLWGGIAANILVLVVMKYLPFLSQNLKDLSALLLVDAPLRPAKALVSIGVSYYVFQALSYLIDIYLETGKAERHLGYFALYLAFFPKLLQGPIERGGDLLPQLKESYVFDYDQVRSGMLLFAWGLFKKVVLADRLALFVDPVYNNVHAFSGLPLLLATYLYAFQIYLDFSGYTDMALGSARLFNINLTQNFNSPYLATSVADFWRRWHISFSRWILDYIFKPLQMQWRSWMNRGTAAALVATFLVSGIWHGASWGFVIWGALHGFYMACSVFYKPYQKKLHKALGVEKSRLLQLWQVFVTFNLVSFAWIVFRANTVADAGWVVAHLFQKSAGMHLILAENKTQALVAMASCSILVLTGIARLTTGVNKSFYQAPVPVRWMVYTGLTLYILLFNFSGDKLFIYTQF